MFSPRLSLSRMKHLPGHCTEEHAPLDTRLSNERMHAPAHLVMHRHKDQGKGPVRGLLSMLQRCERKGCNGGWFRASTQEGSAVSQPEQHSCHSVKQSLHISVSFLALQTLFSGDWISHTKCKERLLVQSQVYRCWSFAIVYPSATTASNSSTLWLSSEIICLFCICDAATTSPSSLSVVLYHFQLAAFFPITASQFIPIYSLQCLKIGWGIKMATVVLLFRSVSASCMHLSWCVTEVI